MLKIYKKLYDSQLFKIVKKRHIFTTCRERTWSDNNALWNKYLRNKRVWQWINYFLNIINAKNQIKLKLMLPTLSNLIFTQSYQVVKFEKIWLR